jgi:hypothetical protein
MRQFSTGGSGYVRSCHCKPVGWRYCFIDALLRFPSYHIPSSVPPHQPILSYRHHRLATRCRRLRPQGLAQSRATELRYHHVCVGSEPIASSTAERNTTGDPNTGYTRGNPHPQPQTHTRQSRKREGRDRGAGVASLQSTARCRKGWTGHAQVLINGIGWAT